MKQCLSGKITTQNYIAYDWFPSLFSVQSIILFYDISCNLFYLKHFKHITFLNIIIDNIRYATTLFETTHTFWQNY